MKKIISIIVVSVLLVSMFTACAKDDGKKTIGLSFPAADHGWLGAVIAYAEEEAKASGFEYIVTTADNPNKQTSDIEDLIAKKVDVIVMLPIESAPLTPVAKKVMDAGIELVIFDREIESSNYTALVKGDNSGIGINAAKYIGEELGGKGKVAIIAGPPCSVTSLRVDGFKDTLADMFPDMEIVAEQDGGFQKEKGYEVMQNILTAQSQIDAVYTIDDEMGLGALQAIKEVGRTDVKVFTGAGGFKGYYEEIKSNQDVEMATFLYSPLMVKEAVKVAVDLLNGKTVSSKDMVIPADLVADNNIDSFYKPDSVY